MGGASQGCASARLAVVPQMAPSRSAISGTGRTDNFNKGPDRLLRFFSDRTGLKIENNFLERTRRSESNGCIGLHEFMDRTENII